MKIALFHNTSGGGAKRALVEHARHLRARGYVLDGYVLSVSNENYLPLAPLCDKFTTYELPRVEGRVGQRLVHHPLTRPLWRVLGQNTHGAAAEVLDYQQQNRQLAFLDDVYAAMARDIDQRGYDLAYVHQCHLSLSPSLLSKLTLPSVYYCQDSLRSTSEWSRVEQADYDAFRETLYRRKRLGETKTLPTLRFLQRAEQDYVRHTRAATQVLANSWYSREAILRTTGVNARVCYLGIDADYFSPDPTVEREPLVLSVGALEPRKRHDFILEAVARIAKARRPRLQIIGYEEERVRGADGLGPYAKKLLCLAEQHEVELTITKDVSDELLRDRYRRASVLAFAPYLEPFGLVPLEAMACGLPVAGVSEGGVRETVQDGVNGLLTGRDPGEFAMALDRLLTNKAFAAQLGANGREAVCDRWTWNRSTDTLERCFEQALSCEPTT